MKKLISTFCIMLTLAFMPLNSLSINAKTLENPYSQFIDDPYYTTSFDNINGLRDKLITLPASGTVSIDFLAQEILLHRMALLTSSTVTGYSGNPELTEIASDIQDDFSGELREMREALSKFIDDLQKNKKANNDSEYMQIYKNTIAQMTKDLSNIDPDDSVEAIYTKQNLAILQAANTLAKEAVKYEKDSLTKKISDSIIQNTEEDIASLKELLKGYES